jgi:hypothetical protein
MIRHSALLSIVFLLRYFPVGAQLPDYLPAGQLLAWYPFNGNVVDESGNGMNGTIAGAQLTLDRNGISNAAFRFDVNQFITLEGISLPENFTICAWVKLIQYNADNVSSIISRYPPSGNGYELNIDPSGRGIFGIMGPEQIPANSVISSVHPPLNEWVHVAWTKSGNTSKLWLNGGEIFTTASANAVNSGSGTTYFGRAQWGGNPFRGELDDIGIWSYALSSAEIDQIYSETLPIEGCLDAEACNFLPEALIDNGTCIYAEPGLNCDGTCVYDFNQNGWCDEAEVWGCTYAGALNYNAFATGDNGSCVFSCSGDLNADGMVDTGDILIMLAVYGTPCP